MKRNNLLPDNADKLFFELSHYHLQQLLMCMYNALGYYAYIMLCFHITIYTVVMNDLRLTHLIDTGGISIPVLFPYMNSVDCRVCLGQLLH